MKKYSGKLFLICLVIIYFIIFSSVTGYCKEPVPRGDFIKLTENALDALDEVESTLNHSTPRIEIQKALNKSEAANKRYKRYVPDVWPKGSQREIVGQLSAAHYYYGVYLFTELQSDESKKAGETAATKARKLFRKYKGE